MNKLKFNKKYIYIYIKMSSPIKKKCSNSEKKFAQINFFSMKDFVK